MDPQRIPDFEFFTTLKDGTLLVTTDGKVGMSVGDKLIVKSLAEWFCVALAVDAQAKV